MKDLLAWTTANGNAITAIATVVLVFVTMYYAWVTRSLLIENKLLRKAGSEPEVVVYLKPGERYFNVIDIVAANIGNGPALNLTIGFEFDQHDAQRRGIHLGPTLTEAPVPALPQCERITTSLGTGPELLNPEPMKPIRATAEFSNLSGQRLVRTYSLEVAQLLGLIRTGVRARLENGFGGIPAWA